MILYYVILFGCSTFNHIIGIKTKALFDVNDHIDIAFESSSDIIYIGRLSSNQNAAIFLLVQLRRNNFSHIMIEHVAYKRQLCEKPRATEGIKLRK